jgi:hypothetical protein
LDPVEEVEEAIVKVVKERFQPEQERCGQKVEQFGNGLRRVKSIQQRKRFWR